MKTKLKRFFYYISLVLCFTYICTSSYLQLKINTFSSDNVKSNIEALTSPLCEGRLTGTSGNYHASNLIENSFKESNLLPYKNKYRESFKILCPTLNNQTPKLAITDSSDSLIKEFKYGTDYKEDLINFRISNVKIDRMDKVTVCLDSIIIIQGIHKYLFRINNFNSFKFRSSFNANSTYDFCINITSEVYNDILDSLRNNCTVNITLPYSVTSKYGYNIVGMIKGTSNSLPPLILSAHYDHLGKDCLGNYYNGALDNASGTSFLLELSKYFSSMIKPKRDIIFVAFTGEELGLKGSKEFVNSNFSDIKDATVINFDMIGAKDTPITIMNGFDTFNDEKQNTLINLFKNTCIEKNIDYNIVYKNSSDHASFCDAGICALTLCHSDISRIHTPRDTMDYIDVNSVNDIFNIVEPVIYELSYDKVYLLLYSYKITLAVTIAFILLIFIKNNTKA